MKSGYFLVPLIASTRTMASPLMDGANAIANSGEHLRAPDPPPAPTPLPPSRDGVLADELVINYTPNNPSNRQHSCWTPPKSRPPPSSKYSNGTCSVCMVQRQGIDHSSDYQFWARDDQNNAMGNIGPVTMWPIDAMEALDDNVRAIMPMGGSDLLVQAERSNSPTNAMVSFVWALPPWDPNNSSIWDDESAPHAMFDPTVAARGDCVDAGIALNDTVRYVQCFFDC